MATSLAASQSRNNGPPAGMEQAPETMGGGRDLGLLSGMFNIDIYIYTHALSLAGLGVHVSSLSVQ